MKTKKLKFTENTNVTLDPMGAKAKPETGNLKPALRMENTKNSKDFRRFPEISNHFWKKYEDRSGFTIYDLLSRAMAAGHLSELVRPEKPGTPKGSKCSGQLDAQPAGREARPATPGAGVLPNFQ
jgi:hypothetical protein